MQLFSKTAFAFAILVAAPTVAAAQCPSYSISGSRLSYTSEQAWTPRGHSVVAGGDLNLSNCGSVPGVGHIIQSPDFTMDFDAQGRGRMLEIRVDAQCDAVLLVNTATGSWEFNDDTNGTDPAIRIHNAPSGQYDIWVGTYNASTCAATMTVETF